MICTPDLILKIMGSFTSTSILRTKSKTVKLRLKEGILSSDIDDDDLLPIVKNRTSDKKGQPLYNYSSEEILIQAFFLRKKLIAKNDWVRGYLAWALCHNELRTIQLKVPQKVSTRKLIILYSPISVSFHYGTVSKQWNISFSNVSLAAKTSLTMVVVVWFRPIPLTHHASTTSMISIGSSWGKCRNWEQYNTRKNRQKRSPSWLFITTS